MAPELQAAIDALVNELHIADYIYDVRESISGDSSHSGSSWDHPKVKRFSECVAVLTRYSTKPPSSTNPEQP